MSVDEQQKQMNLTGGAGASGSRQRRMRAFDSVNDPEASDIGDNASLLGL